jgi:hypothetical protein
LHETPHARLVQTAEPEPGTGGLAQAVPQLPQFTGSVDRFRHPLGHIVCPVGQTLQSVPAVLQPLGQLIVVVTQAWAWLHIAADVSVLPVHDCAAPQVVPTALFPLSTQTETPVWHDVLPSLQGLVGEQVTPAVHGTQLPVRQTMLVPQVFPSAAFVPVSVHTAAPVSQVSVPV